MTLVLSMATPEWVVQVADRRISHLETKAVMPDANKSVMLCNRMVFAYTGMSVLESQPTAVWLWNAFRELKDQCSTHFAVQHLVKRAAIAVENTNRKHYPRDEDLRQAFVGVGWAALPGDDALSPIICRVTNCHDMFGQLMSVPAKEFTLKTTIVPKGKYSWTQTGTPLFPKERAWLAKRLKKCAKAGTGPATPIRLFCDTIWRVHRRAKHLVSDNLLIMMLPRSAAMRHTITLMTGGGGPRSGVSMVAPGCREANEPLRVEHFAQFAYVPSKNEKPVQYGPLLACPGRGSVGGISITPMKS